MGSSDATAVLRLWGLLRCTACTAIPPDVEIKVGLVQQREGEAREKRQLLLNGAQHQAQHARHLRRGKEGQAGVRQLRAARQLGPCRAPAA